MYVPEKYLEADKLMVGAVAGVLKSWQKQKKQTLLRQKI